MYFGGIITLTVFKLREKIFTVIFHDICLGFEAVWRYGFNRNSQLLLGGVTGDGLVTV